ncbi:MAG: 50S ribosomal protein L4 [Candidatus Kaiserbacteria bacterium GW2011_GWB1_52_6]|uniref:Large ribosomal subunit protein uL4 n=3 Tax=Candidatus Kaiseribacteriota TaxID=1752734 RepID=A0A0G1XMB1_9BACT|nr:MAG: 50S ribosomal protein L4 [Candidatus Kaiserbacteria bacterium GW2011_GWA2_52_12]KKW26237.1 MAG: 50S ribosomal protein L4 [Candidatus Kaiserbacteria bacterium GW2011_GWB1_52_6]KKW32046.1 MAG: 50S ribosomal protein L4 [Candidatus Kaiserbacteria bacterium GW2011_GWC2_52_8b]
MYTAEGKEKGNIQLPESVFNVPWNGPLMHQVVTSMQDNARTPVAHVKTRGEVRGGGKKPWQQKGTGRARHGSIRSPIWKGGGVTHGPLKEKDYSRAIPKKMRAKALFMALSRKHKDGEIIFVDSFRLDTPKTASAKKALMMLSKVPAFKTLATKKRNAALIALPEATDAVQKSFRNIGSVTTIAMRNLNPVLVLSNKYLIIENPEAALAIVSQRAPKK